MENGKTKDDLIYGYYDTPEDRVFEYLEYKIVNNEETKEEYGLFCEVKWTGQMGEYIRVYENLKRELQELHEL